jgi:hypothetical protein
MRNGSLFPQTIKELKSDVITEFHVGSCFRIHRIIWTPYMVLKHRDFTFIGMLIAVIIIIIIIITITITKFFFSHYTCKPERLLLE